MSRATLYQRLIAEAFKHVDLLKDPNVKLQHLLTETQDVKRFKDVYNHLDPVNKRIVESTSLKSAGAWLTAIPSTPDLSMSSDNMKIAVKTFLNIPLIHPKGTPQCYHCHETIQNFAEHSLRCNARKPAMDRHSDIAKCLVRLCKACSLSCIVEPSIFGRNPENGKRNQSRPDILIHEFGSDKSSLAVDVSVANPFIKSSAQAPDPMAAAIARERQKYAKYKDLCKSVKVNFTPFVMDAYGGIPSESRKGCLKPLIDKVETFVPPNWAAPNAKTYWLQSLTIALWNGNARKVKSFPTGTPPSYYTSSREEEAA